MQCVSVEEAYMSVIRRLFGLFALMAFDIRKELAAVVSDAKEWWHELKRGPLL